jgi:hypothetical protein
MKEEGQSKSKRSGQGSKDKTLERPDKALIGSISGSLWRERRSKMVSREVSMRKVLGGGAPILEWL